MGRDHIVIHGDPLSYSEQYSDITPDITSDAREAKEVSPPQSAVNSSPKASKLLMSCETTPSSPAMVTLCILNSQISVPLHYPDMTLTGHRVFSISFLSLSNKLFLRVGSVLFPL